ncbi:MAG: hypothetical protein JWO90_1728 [Solirubrobacterales bacterium]|nr:hypothetical protein [Solirubrobacterales bacterium]
MADLQPLRALHYDLDVAGPLQALIAPPYDVVDTDQRAALQARSPYNVVGVDLPRGEPDPYEHAAKLLAEWQAERALVRDAEPALWALEQRYTGPDGSAKVRRGVLARVPVTDYGPGAIRPHERTHPGPKEDRLRLARATKANISPIFALHAGDAVGPLTAGLGDAEPWGEATDDEGTQNRLWRISDPERIAAAQEAVAGSELLIADGHHRYETARAYADEVGGEGEHRFVLMLLVSLEDPGLTIFPTHRLLDGLKDTAKQEALRDTLLQHFDIERVEAHELAPPLLPGGPLQFGYIDSVHQQPFRLTLRDWASADRVLAGMPEAYRRLDTAVLEALVLMGPVGLTEDDISHLNGLGYSRTDAEALELVRSGTYDAAFFLRPTPVEQVQAIAAAGVNMPPKSTFFYPKVPTGLLFNPLA